MSLAQIMKILPLSVPRLLDGDDGERDKVETQREDEAGDVKMLDTEIDASMVQVPDDQTTGPLPIISTAAPTPSAAASSAHPVAASTSLTTGTVPTGMSTPTAEDVSMMLGDARATDTTRTSTEAGFEDPQQVRRRVAAILGDKAPKARSFESILKTRWDEINKLLRIGAVKNWKKVEAQATGAKILSGTWVDPEDKEKSR